MIKRTITASQLSNDPRWGVGMTLFWTAAVLFFSQFVVGSAVLSYHAQVLGVSLEAKNMSVFADAIMQSVIAGGVLGLLMIVWIVRLKKNSHLSAYLSLQSVRVFDVFKWTILGVLVMLGSSFVFEKLGFEHSQEMPVMLKGTHSTAMMYFAVVLAAPVFEEILFRGFVISGLERMRIPDVASIAVALSAFMWAIIHLQYHAHEMFEVFLLGLVLGFARIKTQSLWTPLVIHMANNLLAIWMISWL